MPDSPILIAVLDRLNAAEKLIIRLWSGENPGYTKDEITAWIATLSPIEVKELNYALAKNSNPSTRNT